MACKRPAVRSRLAPPAFAKATAGCASGRRLVIGFGNSSEKIVAKAARRSAKREGGLHLSESSIIKNVILIL